VSKWHWKFFPDMKKEEKIKIRFMDLSQRQKKLVTSCCFITFYSDKCKKCKYEFVCARKWKVEDFLLKDKKLEVNK